MPSPSGTAPVDHTRGIISSLFAPGPGGQPPQEQHVAHVQTYEGESGTPSRKARFLIIAAVKDGRLKLHKAKENSNGTFSIGKTWPLDDLRGIEVSKRTVEGMTAPQPLEFTLTMNGKAYSYETELPSSQQAAFLVKMVRCWRTYMNGRGEPDLNLIGFSVDNTSSRSATPSRSSASSASGPQQARPSTAAPSSSHLQPSRSEHPLQPPRPSTANSTRTVGSMYPPESAPTPIPNMHRRQSPAGIPPHQSSQPHERQPSRQEGIPPNSAAGMSSSQSSRRVISPPPPIPTPPPGAQVRSGSAHSFYNSTGPGGGVAPNVFARPGERSGSADLGPTQHLPPNRSQPPLQQQPREPPRDQGVGPMGEPRQRLKHAGAPAHRSRVVSTASAGSFDNGSSHLPHQPPPSSTPVAPPTSSHPNIIAPTPKRKVATAEDLIDDDAVLSNVEEMLEGFEWRGGAGDGMGRGRGRADEIEKRLIGELKALEAASIHAIMESDDRVTFVVKHLDDALAELDKMDLMIGLYKSQLNLMTDDIAHIESQNRGLQVQTSNQRTLLSELDNLLETIHIPEKDLIALSQESLESPAGIERLEKAGVSLYKALLSTRDTAVGDMAAASERGGEYRSKASSFSKRIFDFLVDQLVNPKTAPQSKSGPLPSHDVLEEYLGRYCGLMLFVKEIDQSRYQQICSAYFTAMSDLYRQEIQSLIGALRSQIRKPSEEELDSAFAAVRDSPTIRQQSMRRAGTLVRSPNESRSKEQAGKIMGYEAFGRALTNITPSIVREQGFIADFLHINEIDESITFADYMELETFFRRGATTYLQSQQGKLKDIRSAMEGVFGFLEPELRDWIDTLLKADSMQIVGVLAALDRAIQVAEKDRNEYLLRILQRQYQKSLAALDRFCKDQLKAIEQTKLTLKKRKGVVPFVRIFPHFVERVESQLERADQLNIRGVIDETYERIVATIFDSLQQMAKMDGEGHGVAAEDKDQLNYHVIIIENMHHIVTVFTKKNVPALLPFISQAREKYNKNLELYIKLVLRRPLARVLDFFQGLEQLLRTTPPTEVSLHSAYTKSALRRVASDVRAKDLRKAIDALYKRVDKHFGDVLNPSAEHTLVIKTVWKACEEEMQRLTSLWKSLIERCYPDDKVGLEFSRDDVHEFFSKAHVS